MMLCTVILLASFIPMMEDASALLYPTDTNIAYVDASFIGEDREERLGASVTVLGDINGDGFDDFAFLIFCIILPGIAPI